MKHFLLLSALALCATASAKDINPVLKPLRSGTEQAVNQRRAFAALKPTPFANATSDDVVELHINGYNTTFEHFEYAGDWYCTFFGRGSNGADYDFHLDIYTDDIVGHFTESDLDNFYTWGRKDNVEFAVTEADITIDVVGEGLYRTDAVFKTTLDETLHIVVDPVAPPMDDINIEAKEFISSFFYDPDWFISVEQFDEYVLSLDMTNHAKPGQLEGSYTTSDCYLEFCMVRDKQTGIEAKFTEVEFTVVGDDLEHNIDIQGQGVLENGRNVTFHYAKNPPIDPVQTLDVDVTLDVVRFMDPTFYRHTTMQATSTDGQLQFSLGYNGVTGLYTDFDGPKSGITYLATGQSYDLDHGKINVTIGDNWSLSLAAELVFADSICYKFNVSRPLDIKAYKDVEAHNMTVSNLFGIINYLIGSNDEYKRIQASTNLDLNTGDYAEFMIFALEAVDGTGCSSLAVKQANLTQDLDGNFTLEAEFLGDDMVVYSLLMDFFVPDVTETAEFKSDKAELRDLTVDYGAFQIMAQENNGRDYLTLVLDDFYVHTAHYSALSSVNRDYCQVIRNLGLPGEEVLPIYTCYLDITVDGRSFTLTGSLQAGTVEYTVDLTGKFEEEQLQGDPLDDANSDLEIVFSADEITDFDERPQYGYTKISAKNDLGQSFTTLIYMDGLGLEEGVYDINNSYAPGTVQAGMVADNQAYPTLYIAYDADGNALLPLWLCVAGTVTVSYVDDQVSLLVDATNTWGRHAFIQVNPDTTSAIKTLSSESNQNGKYLTPEGIVLRHEGKEYSAYGQNIR